MKRRLIGALACSAVGLGLVGAGGQPARAASTAVSQSYTCKVSFLTETGTVTVSGVASENTTSTVVLLKTVVFTFKNTFGTTVTVNHVKFSVPDPNNTSAPYIAGSARIGTTPPGWTAGHDSNGIFGLYAGSATVSNGQTVSNAPLSGKYKDNGPAGTVINFVPGRITFNVTSPISGSATCTPNGPLTFASVTE